MLEVKPHQLKSCIDKIIQDEWKIHGAELSLSVEFGRNLSNNPIINLKAEYDIIWVGNIGNVSYAQDYRSIVVESFAPSREGKDCYDQYSQQIADFFRRMAEQLDGQFDVVYVNNLE